MGSVAGGEKVKRAFGGEVGGGIPSLAWRALGIVVGGIFVYAGAVKAADPVRFVSDIENYHLLPWAIGARLAFYLPWLEIFCGLALIARRFADGAAAILTVLMVTFIGATVAAKVRGIDITCGCFGHGSDNWSFPAHIAVDLALLVALVALLWRERRCSQEST